MRHGRHYTPDEDRILLAHAGRKPAARIAAMLGRSPASVRGRLVYHGWVGRHSARHRVAVGGWRRQEIAALFRVDAHSVGRWVEWGWLPVHRTPHVEPPIYYSDPTDLVVFLERGGAYLDYLAPTDPFWRSLILDVRADLDRQYIRREPLAAMLGVGRRTITHLMNRLGFPRPAIVLGSRFSYYDRAAIRAWLTDHPRYITRRTQEAL